jgi:hypothetical protein
MKLRLLAALLANKGGLERPREFCHTITRGNAASRGSKSKGFQGNFCIDLHSIRHVCVDFAR